MLRPYPLAIALILYLALPAAAQSRSGELRGAWMGEGYQRDWPAIMQSLQENGFNALFPNLSTGGAAFYPSRVLPAAAGAPAGRDELAEACKAAQQYGIELHIWRINWVLFHCPPGLRANYESAGRLMRNSKGGLARDDAALDLKVDWLCPSHPENRKLEKEAMLELVRRYPVAGIHFDYMRYPSPDYCFCDHCKATFEHDAGLKIATAEWPAAVTGEGRYANRYADWRRRLQTSLVAEISKEAHRIKPDVFVSLAAWPDREVSLNHVLQDWPAWVDNGSLDFICFMDYTLDDDELVSRLRSHRRLVRGAIPVYSGLGAFIMNSPHLLARQIQITRAEGADGFLAFAYYSGDFDKWLPLLHATATSSDPNPMPHRSLPAVFSFSLPASDKPLTVEELPVGSKIEVEVSLGLPQPLSADGDASQGAQQAASVLRQALDPRAPIPSYDSPPGAIAGGEDRPRVSGRIVAESPVGLTLAVLSAFDADYGIQRRLRLTVPEGPFRVAVYGDLTESPAASRAFVLRSPLLIGVRQEASAAAPDQSLHSQIASLLHQACDRAAAANISQLAAAVQIYCPEPDNATFWLRINNGECQSGEGLIADPDITIQGSAKDILAFARKEEDPYALWNSGRLIVSGNLRLAEKLVQALSLAPAG